MVADIVNAATSEKLKEIDWMKNIEICELVTRDNRLAKDVVKHVKKRLKNKNPNVHLFSVMLLEMLMNNCGECIHRQVIDAGLLPILVNIVKKKNDLPVRERIFLLLDAMQTSLGGASGKFPQYYAAYYDLVAAQVEFPQRPRAPPKIPDAANEQKLLKKVDSKICETSAHPTSREGEITDSSSVIEKAVRILEVLCEVLNSIDPQNPEGASDEFMLDLVEQCSFHKQRLVHLIMICRDEKIVSQAIELNEQFHGALAKHDALLSVKSTSTASLVNHSEYQEEDPDGLLRRIRKGKACATDQSAVSLGSFKSTQDENSRFPLLRPLCIEPKANGTLGTYQKPPTLSQVQCSPRLPNPSSPPSVSLPPPPVKHLERERFFKEKQQGQHLSTHLKGLSLHSQDGSSSYGSSCDFNDRDPFSTHDQH